MLNHVHMWQTGKHKNGT